MDKKKLREKYLTKRDNLDSNYRKNSSQEIFNKLEQQSFFKKARTIFIYVNFGSEVITLDFINKYKDEKIILVPKIVAGEMKLVKFTSLSKMKKNNYGILEPITDEFYTGHIDLVITPSIAFAKDGYRLGYGGGYYDKFFAKNSYSLAVGVSFEKAIQEKVVVEKHDKKVDYIISEKIIRKTTDKIIVTTGVKTTDDLKNKAELIANKLGYSYFKRNKETIKYLLQYSKGVIVVYKEKTSYYSLGNNKIEQLFFHLDTAMLRIINNSDNEPLIELMKDSDTIIDATMGLARDSIVLSYYNYKVTAVEENKIIHYIVDEGLKNYNSGNDKIDNAMRKIETINMSSYDYLKQCKDNSYDIVYFDPMFSEEIKESENLIALENLAKKERLTTTLLKEAIRVAKKRVIVKAHFRDEVFDDYNFTRITRKNTKFHYGYIDVEN